MDFLKIFRRKKIRKGTINDPDFADKVEPATDEEGKQFEVDGVKYYRFKKDTVMPYGRYMYLETFIKQVDLRLDSRLLEKFLDQLENSISGEKGSINLTKAYQVILNMKSRLKLTFETETIHDYASVIYFDETEDLYTYDTAHNREKIKRWREADAVDFFYIRPMSELLHLKDTSKEDLINYLNLQAGILNESLPPNLETPPA